MKPDQIIRSTVSGALSVSAKALSVAARITSEVAKRARPGRGRGSEQPSRPATTEQRPSTPAEVTPEQLAKPLPETDATVSPPPTEPVPDAPSHVRTAETHAAELAAKGAAEVIEAVAELSTDELRQLFEHESTHKKRKTVLKAIEDALTPSASSGGTTGARQSPSSEPLPEAGGVPTGGADGAPDPADTRS
jgi:hypothetical protein